MSTPTYDPKLVMTTFGEHLVVGIADGTFIEVEQNEANFTTVVGSDGKALRVKNNNRSGKIKVTLLQTAASNDFFSAAMAADLQNNTGAKPFMLKDGSGRTVLSAQEAWVSKPPTVGYAKDHTTREWELETAELTYTLIGGAGT